ncbi:MAG: YfiR family protein [Gammaproteobacteria bacterium]
MKTHKRTTFEPRCLVPAILVALLFCAPAFSKAADVLVTEYRIKAAFLYNFTRFVDWPKQATSNNDIFSLCILGTDVFGEYLTPLESKAVNGQALRIRRIEDAAAAGNCQLVFISESSAGDMKNILSKLGKLPVLTVSDADNFTELGGIIQFRLIDNKVRFDVNIDAADNAGLNISSKLLSLANAVKKGK